MESLLFLQPSHKVCKKLNGSFPHKIFKWQVAYFEEDSPYVPKIAKKIFGDRIRLFKKKDEFHKELLSPIVLVSCDEKTSLMCENLAKDHSIIHYELLSVEAFHEPKKFYRILKKNGLHPLTYDFVDTFFELKILADSLGFPLVLTQFREGLTQRVSLRVEKNSELGPVFHKLIHINRGQPILVEEYEPGLDFRCTGALGFKARNEDKAFVQDLKILNPLDDGLQKALQIYLENLFSLFSIQRSLFTARIRWVKNRFVVKEIKIDESPFPYVA